MSNLPDTTKFDTCGCCEADLPEPSIYNPPGLPALAYRIGTHSEFLRRMLVRLPRWIIPNGEYAQQRPLARLTTRSPDDPAIAMLDAWAVVGDVLTFYQERIANEGFLRTATERRSVLELARAIGYELDPGVAASTYLVFTVEDAEQLPDTAVIPAWTQVQSIPAGNDELPQTFETSDEFEARVQWNELKPRTTEPQTIEHGLKELYLDGINTNLQAGDAILLVGSRRKQFPGSERWDFRILKTVEACPGNNYTRVTWELGLGHEEPTVEPADNPEVYALRLRAALFGHNAPDWRTMPDSIQEAYAGEHFKRKKQWPDFDIETVADHIIDLDAVYPSVVVGSWVVLSKPSYVELYNVKEAATDSRTDYTLTAKVTRLKLDSREHLSWFPLRDTVVFAESEELALAGTPIKTPIDQSKTIKLQGQVDGMGLGKVIVISGKKTDDDESETVSEVAVVESAKPPVDLGDYSYTEITLQEPLTGKYERSSVTVYANVVHATHGETVAGEVLGSGDGSQSFQTFQLKKPPLTYVSSANGSESTLSLRVEAVQWQQRPSLFAAGRDSHSYTVRINDGAKPSVIFGDGRDGARLPTGPENIRATYRSGIGLAGNVGAGSLTLLKTKPFGIRSVTNPRVASGGEDPERLADARQNAPVTVLTLERVVSLRDYEDYARSFTGIGKAGADTVWVGEAEIVHVTLATADGQPVERTLSDNLADAIEARRDPLQELRLGSFESLLFNVDASVLIDAAYEWETVRDEIETALREAFSFNKRKFAQPVSAAEVITVIHAVAGVVAVDLNELVLAGDDSETETSLATVLQARHARFENGEVLPAQMLLINTAGIDLTEMQP